MTLDELNSSVATATGMKKTEASKAVTAVLHGIQDALKKGGAGAIVILLPLLGAVRERVILPS